MWTTSYPCNETYCCKEKSTMPEHLLIYISDVDGVVLQVYKEELRAIYADVLGLTPDLIALRVESSRISFWHRGLVERSEAQLLQELTNEIKIRNTIPLEFPTYPVFQTGSVYVYFCSAQIDFESLADPVVIVSPVALQDSENMVQARISLIESSRAILYLQEIASCGTSPEFPGGASYLVFDRNDTRLWYADIIFGKANISTLQPVEIQVDHQNFGHDYILFTTIQSSNHIDIATYSQVIRQTSGGFVIQLSKINLCFTFCRSIFHMLLPLLFVTKYFSSKREGLWTLNMNSNDFRAHNWYTLSGTE